MLALYATFITLVAALFAAGWWLARGEASDAGRRIDALYRANARLLAQCRQQAGELAWHRGDLVDAAERAARGER